MHALPPQPTPTVLAKRIHAIDGNRDTCRKLGKHFRCTIRQPDGKLCFTATFWVQSDGVHWDPQTQRQIPCGPRTLNASWGTHEDS